MQTKNSPPQHNVVDAVLGIDADSALYQVRRERPEFVDGVESCRASVLWPNNDQGIPAGLRVALAQRIALQSGNPAQAAFYQSLAQDGQYLAIAHDTSLNGQPEWLLAVVRHSDRVTLQPQSSTQQHLEALSAAGLSEPQIVALAELIAFVNFESRVMAGLQLLEKM